MNSSLSLHELAAHFLADPDPIYVRADRARSRAQSLHDHLLDPIALRQSTDEALSQALMALYRQTAVSPLFGRSIPRQVARIRAGLLNLVSSADALAAAVDALLQPDGSYYVPGLGRSFYSPLLQALKPGEFPAFTSEMEAGLRAVNAGHWPEGISPGERYEMICQHCSDLRDHLGLRDVFVVEQFLEYALAQPEVQQASSAAAPIASNGVAPDQTTSHLPPTDFDSTASRAEHRLAEPAAPYSPQRSGSEDHLEEPAACFTPDTFAILAELRTHNNTAWFEANQARFEQQVAKPLRWLVAQVGQTVITPLDPLLETDPSPRKTLSRIARNRYGRADRAPYYDHLWAAFYRENYTRHTDAQLLIRVSPEGADVGFHVGRRAWQALEQFHLNISEHPQLFLDLLESLPFRSEIMITGGSDLDKGHPLDVEEFEDVLGLIRYADVRLVRHFPAGDSRITSPNFAHQVGETLRAIYPLYLFAARPDILAAAGRYLAQETTVVEEGMLDGDGAAGDRAGQDVEQFLAETLLPRSTVEDLLALLANKRQIVLYGPPGTGKTFIARKLARLWAGTSGEIKLVQFHSSFSYEEFIEGIRPQTRDVDGRAELVYRVEDGLFKAFCNRARATPEGQYVLIVDEINRGDVARIFGELLYLLEYRQEKVELPYSRQSFNIPANVYLIATMNTADRSIALVDQALRRRFHFVPLYPDPELLARWLELHAPKMVWVADLLAAINRLLGEDGVEPENWLGHSHFMDPHLDERMLARIWTYTLRPTIAEIFYNQPGRLAKYDQLVQQALADSKDLE